MNTKQLTEIVTNGNGQFATVVEWRGSTARVFTQGEGAQKATSKSIVHRIEIGDKQLEVVEKVAKEQEANFDVEAYNTKPKPFKKGDRVVWHLKSYGWSGEGKSLKLKASGTIEKFEP